MDNNTNPTNPNPTNPQPTPPNPATASPLSGYPPMGTMTIGTPAGALGTTPQQPQPQPQGATPLPSSTPIPAIVPTTYGDNHAPEKKHNKTILIIVGIVLAVIVVIGAVVAVMFMAGNKHLSCSKDITEDRITYHTEIDVDFVFYHAEQGNLRQEIVFPYRINERYATEYKDAIEKDSRAEGFDSIKVYYDSTKNAIITEGVISINHLTETGKSFEEVKKNYKSENYICSEK